MPPSPSTPSSPALFGYVIHEHCVQDGGCPEWDAWMICGSRDGVCRYIERNLRDEQIRSLLFDCDFAVDIHVVRDGAVHKTITARPYLWSLYRGAAYHLSNKQDLERMSAAVEKEYERYEANGPLWTTVLAWEDLRAALPQLKGTPVAKGQMLSFELKGKTRRLVRADSPVNGPLV
jgi:hypothetical protein